MSKPFALRKLKQIGRKFGFDLVNAAEPAEFFYALLKHREKQATQSGNREREFLSFIIKHFDTSHAQLFQDMFALFVAKEKRAGYFVEFGATDGMTLSNSYSLEKHFGWHGILAEPARSWHKDLRQNRSCIVDTSCVWCKSGERLEFIETPQRELSTIRSFAESDGHSKNRQTGDAYSVETISLNDLLKRHNAPYQIDYLSVDTEGSELMILSNFDFSKHDIQAISVEHNYTPEREKIRLVLNTYGYDRVFGGFPNGMTGT